MKYFNLINEILTNPSNFSHSFSSEQLKKAWSILIQFCELDESVNEMDEDPISPEISLNKTVFVFGLIGIYDAHGINRKHYHNLNLPFTSVNENAMKLVLENAREI